MRWIKCYIVYVLYFNMGSRLYTSIGMFNLRSGINSRETLWSVGDTTSGDEKALAMLPQSFPYHTYL
jgi:hypothetical protein